MDCRARCWIAGGVAGLLVFLLAGLMGEAGVLAGILLGLLTAVLLRGFLVWGVCDGAGSAADNAAFMEVNWIPEPFEPSRRVVAAGGTVVSAEPMPEAGPLDATSAGEAVILSPAHGSTVNATITEGTPATLPEPEPEPTSPSMAFAGLHAAMGVPPLAEMQQPLPAETMTHDEDAPVPAQPASGAVTSAARQEGTSSDPAAEQRLPSETVTDPEEAPSTVGSEGKQTGLGPSETAPLVRDAGDADAIDTQGLLLPGDTEADSVQPPERPLSEGEALTMESLGAASPKADAEAGADPREREGGIVPLRRDDEPNRTDAGGQGARRASEDRPTPVAQTGTRASDGQSDDMTRLKGVGPMLATWLADQGITRFEQIAAWDDADIARYAGMMGRMGRRIRGEDWVGQARALVSGRPAGQDNPGRAP